MRWRAPSPPLLVARRLTACSTICAPSLTSLLAGLRVVPCRHGLVQGPPTSAPSTTRRCGPPATSSGYVPRLRRSATRSAAPSTSALHGCGCRVRVSASQHKAWPVGVAPYTSMSRCRRSPGATPGAVVCASHGCGTTCPSGPTASRATWIHARHHLGPPGEQAGAWASQCVVTESVHLSCTAWRRANVPKRWARACAIAGARPAA